MLDKKNNPLKSSIKFIYLFLVIIAIITFCTRCTQPVKEGKQTEFSQFQVDSIDTNNAIQTYSVSESEIQKYEEEGQVKENYGYTKQNQIFHETKD